MATRGNNAQGRTSSSHFDFEEFKEQAISAQVLQSIEPETCEQLKRVINELESSIKKKDKKKFELKLCDLEKLVIDKKIRKLKILKDLRDKWMLGKSKGGDFFQFINMKGDSLPPSVSSATTISEKKGATSNKLEENVDVQRLRKIAEILDDENQEKGAKQKKLSDVDDLLTKIEEACQEVVERRKKSAMEGVNKFARFNPLVIWATEFGKCVEKKTFMEDGIDPSTRNANDKEVKAILETLNRSMKLLHAQKEEQDSLEKNMKTKANELMLLLKTKQPTINDKKKPSCFKDQNIESIDTVKVMDSCISELKIRLQLEVGSDEWKESTKIEKQTKDDYMAILQRDVNDWKERAEKERREKEDYMTRFNKLNEEIASFKDEMLQELVTATKTLTREETEPVSRQGKYSKDFELCLNAAEQIKIVANEILITLDVAFDNIIGEGCLYHEKNFDRSKSKPWGHVQGRIQIIFEMAIENGITGEQTRRQSSSLKQLKLEVNDWKEKAEKKKRKKEDYMASLQRDVNEWKQEAEKERREKEDYMTRFDKLKEEIASFKDEMHKELVTATKTLTREETKPVSRQEKNSKDFELCLNAAEKIKNVANEILASLEAAFDNIIGEGCLYHGNNFDKSKSKPWGHVQGRIQIIFEMAVENGITGEKKRSQSSSIKQLQRNLDDWREKAEKEKREKEDQMARFQLEIIRLKERAEIEKREKEDYMTRFPKIASAQLMDNNLNIADLSDQNRPTKLAEEYSEIYDNEWTDAYTYLEKEIKTEPERIDILLQILLNVYGACCKIRDQQLNGMKIAILRPAKFYYSQNQVQQVAERHESVEKPNAQQGGKGKSPVPAKSKEKKSNGDKDDDMKLDPVHSKTLTDIGKETSATTIDDVLEYFKTQQKQLFEAEPMDRYSTKLIRLCWLMRLHSPPVCIGSIEEKGSKFDKTKYRAYTKSGKKIEFVVWPTLLFHENGGMLKQGTAQGF